MLTPPFAAGQEITAASLSGAAPLAAYCFADDPGNGQSNTTLANATSLNITMAAGGTYVGYGMIIYAASTTADYDCTFTVPTGANGWWIPGVYTGSGGNAYVQPAVPLAFAATATAGGQGTSSNQWLGVQFTVVMGATAGNLQWQFTQHVSDASNINTRAYSYLLAWKIA